MPTNIATETITRLLKMLRDWERYSRDLIDLLGGGDNHRRLGSSPAQYIVLSKDMPAGDGITKLGHGKGKIAQFTPGTKDTDPGKLSVPSGAMNVDVYSLPPQGIKSGSTIIAIFIGAKWHYVYTTCGNAGSTSTSNSTQNTTS